MGVRFAFSRRDAIAAGVSMVTQETSLAPHLSVLENIFLPELAKPGRLNWSSNRQQAIALIDELQISVDSAWTTRLVVFRWPIGSLLRS